MKGRFVYGLACRHQASGRPSSEVRSRARGILIWGTYLEEAELALHPRVLAELARHRHGRVRCCDVLAGAEHDEPLALVLERTCGVAGAKDIQRSVAVRLVRIACLKTKMAVKTSNQHHIGQF